MPVISIIVPVYNVEKYLRRCLNSIIVQTFTGFECILIDDGSPDTCPAICDEYAAKDGRFKVIHQENAGVSAARNAGLDAARGEWIGFVDSDDWCEPDMFQVLYENAARYNADVSICGLRMTAGDEKIRNTKNKTTVLNKYQSLVKMLNSSHFGGFSFNKLVKASIFSQNGLRYDKNIHYLEDVFLFYNVFKHSEKIVYSSVVLYNYFQHSEAVTKQFGLTKEAKTAFMVFDTLISMESCKKIRNILASKKVSFVCRLCIHYIKEQDCTNDSFSLLREFIAHNIRTILLDVSMPLRYKAACLLILYPKAHGFLLFLSALKK